MGGASISSLLSSFQVRQNKAPHPVACWWCTGAHCPDRLEEGGGLEDSHSLQHPVLQPPEVPSQLHHQPPDGNAACQPHGPSDPPLAGVGHALPLLSPRHPRLHTNVPRPHLALLLSRLLLLPAGKHSFHSRGDPTHPADASPITSQLFLQDAIQTEETESRTTHLSESEAPARPQITWKLEPLQQVVGGNLSGRATFGRDDINTALKLSSANRLITPRRHRQCNVIPDQSGKVTTDPCERVVRKNFLMSISQAQFTEAKQEETVSSKLGAKLFFFDVQAFWATFAGEVKIRGSTNILIIF